MNYIICSFWEEEMLLLAQVTKTLYLQKYKYWVCRQKAYRFKVFNIKYFQGYGVYFLSLLMDCSSSAHLKMTEIHKLVL